MVTKHGKFTHKNRFANHIIIATDRESLRWGMGRFQLELSEPARPVFLDDENRNNDFEKDIP
ncbi:hypothetical protein JOS77_12335 [Chromobacterium haemolyticum]|nr:hypothetical protein JOS77_12335 [Chromobacterium haemolyticum]